jgi:hypothetical protein
MLGSSLIQFKDMAKDIDETIEDAGYKLGSYHDRSLQEYVESRIKSFMSFIKNKTFPTVSTTDIIPTIVSSYGYGMQSDLYSTFLHQLSLKQLTSDTDLASLLEELISEYIKKI